MGQHGANASADTSRIYYEAKRLAAQLEILHVFAMQNSKGEVLTDGIGVALDLAARLEGELADIEGRDA